MQNKEDRFKAILSENSERIQRICKYYNPNPEDRKDMYQEILVNIWKSLDSFRGDSAISTWIYRIAVNTSLTFTGKVFKEMKLLVNADTQNLNTILDENLFAEKQQKEQQLNQLQIELNTLPVMDKTIISLVLEGLTMKEIADIIGITEPNAKVKVHRIKQGLKERLTQDQPQQMESYKPTVSPL